MYKILLINVNIYYLYTWRMLYNFKIILGEFNLLILIQWVCSIYIILEIYVELGFYNLDYNYI